MTPDDAPNEVPLALVTDRWRGLSAEWPDLWLSVALRGPGRGERAMWTHTERGPRSAPDASRTAPRYLIYSLTKMWWAVASLRLAEAGRLDLDAPVDRWLPERPAAGRISLRQMLRHTSGLPDYGGLPAYDAAVRERPSVPWSADEFLARTNADRLRFEPDAGWAYSNIGYMLVRQIIERAAGHALAAAESRADLADLAPGWSRYLRPGRVVDVREEYHPGWVAHGVLRADAASVVTFLDGLLARDGGTILGDASTAALTTPWPVGTAHPRFVTPCYGLGLMIDPDAARGFTAGHTGEGPGYTAAAYYAVGATGLSATAAVLANVEAAGEVEGLALALLDDALGIA